ncbi:MAG TPA: DUF58 domain-containing protein [Natronosporangium sp.]
MKSPGRPSQPPGRRVNPRLRLTGRGWAVAGLAAVAVGLAVAWRYPGLAAAGAGLLALLAVSLGTAAGRHRLTADRVLAPAQVPRLGDCSATLVVINTGRRLPVLVDGSEPVGPDTLPLPATWLRPGRWTEVGYRVPTERRGTLPVGPLRLRRYGVAGLAARTEFAGGETTVRVLPRVMPVRAVPPAARRGQVTGDERVAQGGTDLVSLREYLPGDDLRRLHWATTARTGTLMVREDADPSQAHVTVVLDDRPASYRFPGADPAGLFEEAVDAAASLAAGASAAGHPVRLRSLGGELDLAVAGGLTGHPDPALLAALAEVTLRAETGNSAAPPPARDLDLLVLVGGAATDLAGLVLAASQAVVGVVLAVDPAPVEPVRTSGSVLVLSAPRAEPLLRGWERTVVEGRVG